MRRNGKYRCASQLRSLIYVTSQQVRTAFNIGVSWELQLFLRAEAQRAYVMHAVLRQDTTVCRRLWHPMVVLCTRARLVRVNISRPEIFGILSFVCIVLTH